MTESKTCSFCGEEILAIAVKCKHCQSMVDGTAQSVNVKNIDPFAQFHTPIKGKTKGKITPIGYIGIFFCCPFLLLGCFLLIRNGQELQGLITAVMVIGMGVGGFFWARR